MRWVGAGLGLFKACKLQHSSYKKDENTISHTRKSMTSIEKKVDHTLNIHNKTDTCLANRICITSTHPFLTQNSFTPFSVLLNQISLTYTMGSNEDTIFSANSPPTNVDVEVTPPSSVAPFFFFFLHLGLRSC